MICQLVVLLAPARALAFEVADAPRWAEHVVLHQGAGTWEIDQGLVFPVVEAEGETEPVGFVVVGPGRASFPFASDGEALRFAFTLAAAGEPLEVARAALEGSWTEAFELALSLGPRPDDAAVWALPPARVDDDVVSYLGPDGQEQVVVTDYRFGNAYAAAKEVVRTRVPVLARAGVDPALARKLEAYDPAGRWVGEAHGTRRWTPFLEPAFRTFDDRWLSFSSDPTGSVDPERRDVVFVHGVGEGEAPRWATLTGRGEPRKETRIELGVANVVLERQGTGIAAEVEVEVVLTLTAGVEGARVVPLVVPHRDAPSGPGFTTVSSTFALQEISADGRPLTKIGPLYGPHEGTEGTGATMLLPQQIPKGGTVKVRMRWGDRWPVGQVVNLREWFTYEVLLFSLLPPTVDVEVRDLPEFAQLGHVAASRRIWPSWGSRPPRYPTELRVGTTNPRWSAALGPGVEEVQQGDGTWWITRGTAHTALTVGDLAPKQFPSVLSFPAIRVDGQEGVVPSPEFMRAVLNFYAPTLPPFPYDTVEVVQDADRLIIELRRPADEEFSLLHMAPQVSAGPGQLVVHPRRYVPVHRQAAWQLPVDHPVERAVAEGLARQWWDRPAYGPRDAWIGPAVSAWYRDRFVEEAYGAKVADKWRRYQDEQLREMLGLPAKGPRPLAAPLQPWSAEIGARFLGDVLEPRIGEPALLKGLRDFLEGEEHTTAALEQALSAASFTPLSDLFTAYVEAGVRPKVDGEVARDGGTVRISLHADPPLSRLEVPVSIETRRTLQTVWIPVQDGRGELEVPARGELQEVVVDPMEWLGPARRLPLPGERVRGRELPEG